MADDINRRFFWAIVADPFGITGFVFMLMGIINVFLYGVNLPENPQRWNYWVAWLYPIILFLIGIPFLIAAGLRLKHRSKKFLADVRTASKNLEKKMEMGFQNAQLTGSEFGISNMDLDVLEVIRDSGGFIPLLLRELENIPFSYDAIRESVAKLWMMGYINVPEKVSMKITITVEGLDVLELPRLTFTTKVPEDIALMVAHANSLYRHGRYQEVILTSYNILERALKVHLIPTIDDHATKWNEKVLAKYGKDKGVEKFFWNGVATKASLNDLWNFYKKNVEIGRKWSELTDRTVKYSTQYLKLLEDLGREEKRVIDKGVDTVADVRSTYAHNKPAAKFQKDAYRILKLTEIVLGMMFDTMKRNAGLESLRYM